MKFYKKLLGFGVILFNLACEKDSIPISSLKKPSDSFNNAKAKKDIDKQFINFNFGNTKIEPLWDQAVDFKNKKEIEVPYMVDKKIFFPSLEKTGKNRGKERLYFHLKGNKADVELITYIPDNNFKGNIHEINVGNFKEKKFSGIIKFKNFKKDESYSWYMKDGKTIKKAKRSKNLDKKAKVLDWTESTHCDWTQICWVNPTNNEYECGDWKEMCYTEQVWVESEIPPYVDPYDCNNNSSWDWCNPGTSEQGYDGDQTPNNEEYNNCVANWDAGKNNIQASNDIINEFIEDNGNNRKKTMIWNAFISPFFTIQSKDYALIHRDNQNSQWYIQSVNHEGLSVHLSLPNMNTVTPTLKNYYIDNLSSSLAKINLNVDIDQSLTCMEIPFHWPTKNHVTWKLVDTF